MRISVASVPREFAGAQAGSAVIVIDVFRASTTIAAALAGGARFVLPVADVEQAMKLAEPYADSEVLLGGERECQRIEGFQLGNSPREYTREVVAGRGVPARCGRVRRGRLEADARRARPRAHRESGTLAVRRRVPPEMPALQRLVHHGSRHTN